MQRLAGNAMQRLAGHAVRVTESLPAEVASARARRHVGAIRRSSSSTATHSDRDAVVRLADDTCNIPENILAKLGQRLHNRQNHPICTIKKRIASYFTQHRPEFRLFDSLSPVVSTRDNFDVLGFPQNHVSRSPSDSYFVSRSHLLRTHTSAHQVPLLGSGERAFLVCGDVYRRDEIDASHYPVFHQLEGLCAIPRATLAARGVTDVAAWLERDLKHTLEGVMAHAFARSLEFRWLDDAFPFTQPSWQLEVRWGGGWLETLGCGVVTPAVLAGGGAGDCVGWAFGLGLDRLAMLLFGIPDVRLFWSTDPRFASQFTSEALVRFAPYSRYPACHKDVSFWLPEGFHANELFDVARSVGGDLIETVSLVDDFAHPKTGRRSQCYRVVYRSHDTTLTNTQVDALQAELRRRLVERLRVELR